MNDKFPPKVKDLLAKRVGYRCSNPHCRGPTAGPHKDPTKMINVGVAAHITAKSLNGPRYDELLTPEQRKAYSNGIWLCQKCQKLVDNDPRRYSVTKLVGWRKIAEDRAIKEIEVGTVWQDNVTLDESREALLSVFSPEFKNHPPEIVSVVDYFNWHRHPSVWAKGSGTICSISLIETSRMWTNIDYFAVFEAFCLNFIKNGGKISRIFVLESPYIDFSRMLVFQRTCFRHQLLNFEPRIARPVRVEEKIKSLSVNCESFGVINNKIVLYQQFPSNSDPLMITTCDQKFILEALKTHKFLWNDSIGFSEWYKSEDGLLTNEIKREVERECEFINKLV